MLAVGNFNGNLRDIRVPLPAVQYSNPSGRDWVVTASFRADENSVGCFTLLDLMNGAGDFRWLGVGGQIPKGSWLATSVRLRDSVNGTGDKPWNIILGAICTGGSAYVDGIAVN